MHRTQVEHLFGDYRLPVFRFLRRFLRDPQTAEDLTQEAFLRALKGAWRHDGNQRAWIFQIARNLARDHLRAAGRRPRIEPLTEQDAGAPDRTLSMALDGALASLGDEDREVFLLREIGGLSYAEIALACGLTADGVRSRLHRTRLALRRQLT